MRFSRNLVGLTLRDRMSIKDIREQSKVKRIDEDIREHQKKLMQHSERMDNSKELKIIMEL